ALLGSANRQTGRVIVSSIWDTAADREASEAAVRDARQAAIQAAEAETSRVALFENVFVNIKQAALT
ncbi:MAG: hypothetical protein M3336_16995, partial [Chloroflexota bacterium]|nr:hypothetical protein [Chloroflexota bacterium]